MRQLRSNEANLKTGPRRDQTSDKEKRNALEAFLYLSIHDLTQRVDAVRNVVGIHPASEELLEAIDAIKAKIDAFRVEAGQHMLSNDH